MLRSVHIRSKGWIKALGDAIPNPLTMSIRSRMVGVGTANL
jgi:hypothetical protein